MLGTTVNSLCILIGTAIGCLLKNLLNERSQNALYQAMGLAAAGIGLENVVQNMPKSRYHVLFIVSLAIGSLIGSQLEVEKHFNSMVERGLHSSSTIATGLSTGILLYCIGALSLVGPVMAAVKGDQTMLLTNATLDFVSSIVLGAGFGWGMLLCAPVLFCWQGLIYLVAKYLSATFFSQSLLVELAIVGGFLLTASGMKLLKIGRVSTLNLLPSLSIPIVVGIAQMLFKF